MIKFFVGIAVVIFTTYCGRFLAKKYRRRKVFFSEMYSFNLCFLEELGYTKRPFEEFCGRRNYDGEFGDLLREVLERRAAKTTTRISMDEYAFLNADERSFVAEYFQAVGRGDSQAQKGYFSAAKGRLEGFKTQGENDDKKYTELYTKLGFLLGLAIMIVLI